jgi:predicted ferric reductase
VINNSFLINNKEEKKSSIFNIFILPISAGLGLLLVFFLLPTILPGLAASISGAAPRAFWYLSRATAISSYLVLWVSMMLGLAMTSQLAAKGTTRTVIFEIHKFTSLMGLFFALFHAFILLGDQFLHLVILDVLIPFASSAYRPLWVGLGQVALYLWAILILSFYVRRQITKKVWRLIHFASFAIFLLALTHGITSGTDAGLLTMQGFYWVSGGLFIFLTIYRILNTLLKNDEPLPLQKSR